MAVPANSEYSKFIKSSPPLGKVCFVQYLTGLLGIEQNITFLRADTHIIRKIFCFGSSLGVKDKSSNFKESKDYKKKFTIASIFVCLRPREP